MNDNLTEIVLIIDKSGSMWSTKEDAMGGINSFLAAQKKVNGEARVTLVDFSNTVDVQYISKDIQEIKPYLLRPNGTTSLLDAVGETITKVGERLDEIDELERPGLVTFIIVTDGGENSSTKYSKAFVRDLVKHQEKKYNWQFTYLGANQDAFSEAGGIGINMSGVANYKGDRTEETYTALSSKVSRMRGKASGMGGQSISALDNTFTDDELREMMDGE